MTDAELIYLLRMHISDIKWHREPDLSEGTVKVLGEAVDAIAARLAQPTPERGGVGEEAVARCENI